MTPLNSLRAVVCLATLVGATGCSENIEQREERHLREMVEMAKADAAAESTFVQDSIRLVESITRDTVEMIELGGRDVFDEYGRRSREPVFKVTTRSGALCVVDSVRGVSMAKGDTLSCQWESRP